MVIDEQNSASTTHPGPDIITYAFGMYLLFTPKQLGEESELLASGSDPRCQSGLRCFHGLT